MCAESTPEENWSKTQEGVASPQSCHIVCWIEKASIIGKKPHMGMELYSEKHTCFSVVLPDHRGPTDGKQQVRWEGRNVSRAREVAPARPEH